MKRSEPGFPRSVLCLLFLLLTLGFLMTPAPARALDAPWEFEFLNPDIYKNWEIRPQTSSVDNANWRVSLTNASCAVPIHLDLSGFVGSGNLTASVEMCTTADFEIEFKNSNWLYSEDLFESRVTKDSSLYRMDIFDTTSLNQVIGWIPYVGNLGGVTFRKQLVGAATAPCIVKGKFTVKAIYKVGMDDQSMQDGKFSRADYESSFQITSVQPTGNMPPHQLTAFVGDYEWLDAGFGKVSLEIKDFSLAELGPVLRGRAGIFAGDMITWQHDRNAFNSALAHQPENLAELHTCADRGKAGCLEGRCRTIQQTWYDWSSHLRAEILGIELFDFSRDWGGDEDYTGNKDRADFHRSLTWNEPLVFGAPCPHRVYRIPVGVWANEARTIPVDGVTVRPAEAVETDPNVEKYTQDVSGTDGRGSGLATLFLPFREGRYTIEGSGAGMEGSAEQPADMVKGLNDQVDLVVSFQEKRTLSVRKEWDIDYENKDRPDEVQVLLQAQYYSHGKNIWQKARSAIARISSWEPVELATLSEANQWTYTFRDVPKYEIIDNHNGMPVLREIRYRIRELKAGDDPASQAADAVFEPDEDGRVLFGDEGDGEEWPRAAEYEQALPEIPGADEAQQQLREAGLRVVHWRWDLDNVSVFPVIKSRLSSWDTYWQIDPNYEAYLTMLAKQMFFPLPTVTWTVPAYTSSVGERIPEHQTKYVVEYSNEGDTTVIKNIACLDISMYKRWLNFDAGREIPEEVWLVLQSRIQEKYLQLAGEAGGRVPYLPVIRPLYGNMTNLASLVGLNIIAKLDVAGIMNIPVAIARARRSDNPLISYRVRFGVRKYDLLTKLPLDFEAGEMSSELIKSVVKALTGLDIPVSVSLTGGGYVTVPGKALNLFRDWELTSNVINVMASLPEEEAAIGGVKYWQGEGWNIAGEEGTGADATRLPASLDIVVKDGERTIGRVRLAREDQPAGSSWPWALTQSDVEEYLGSGTDYTLDPDKTYTISEEFPADYAWADCFVASVDGHNLTNTWAPSPQLVLEKRFEEGAEPREVRLALTDDRGTRVGVYTLNRENGWRVVLKNRASGEPETEDTVELAGHDVSAFRVEELPEADSALVPAVSGPTLSQGNEGNRIWTFTVVNRVQRNLSVKVNKIWQGDREEDRPDQVSVALLRNGEEIARVGLTAEEGWQAEITRDAGGHSLPRLDEKGAEYSYTLEETDPEGYRSAVESSLSGDQLTFTLTNTRTTLQDTVTLRGVKTWVDNNDAAGARPESIRLHILADGRAVRTMRISSSVNSWNVSGLPRFTDSGEAVRYTVYEEPVEGYDTVCAAPVFDAGSLTWTCDVTNSYDTLQVEVRKIWEDEEDARRLRPESVTVRLVGSAGGASRVVASAELTAEGGWRAVFTGLRREDLPGVPITYTLEELRVPGYKAGVVAGSAEEGFTVTNVPDDNLVTIRAEKVWVDGENAEGTRPDALVMRLLQDGKEIDSAVLDRDNGWAHTFTDLPYLKPGLSAGSYMYNVREDEVPGYQNTDYYSGPDFGPMDWVIRYTNTLSDAQELMDIPVRKVWSGGEGFRPGAVTLRLMDGEREVRRLTLTEEDGWQGVFTQVPLRRNAGADGEEGEKIVYTLAEDPVEGFVGAVSGSPEEGFTVTNVWSDTVRFTVTKHWDDDGSLSRPDSVTVYLKQGGTMMASAELTAQEGWTHTFTGLPRTADGQELSWSVSEAAPERYEAQIGPVTSSVSGGITTFSCEITNRLRSDIPARFTVRKLWQEEDGSPLNWPEGRTVTLHLMQNGQELESAALSADHPVHTFEGLPAADDQGYWYAYTVEEDDPGDFIPSLGPLSASPGADGAVEYSCELINRRMPRFMDISLEKKWDDGEYPDRPRSVTVHLLADGEEAEGSPVVLTVADGWKTVFTDRPLYGKSGKIVYSVSEDPLDAPYYAVITGSAKGGFTITNHINPPGKTAYRLIKQWLDEGDRLGLRPKELKVDLMRYTPATMNSPEVAASVVLSDAYALPADPDRWAWTFTGLDLTDETGAYYIYYVAEAPVDGYMDWGTTSGVTNLQVRWIEFSNQINRFQTISVRKRWLEEDGQPASEGLPGAVRVNLIREDDETGDQVVQSIALTAEGNWQGAFAPVPLYTYYQYPIHYRVEEVQAEGWSGTASRLETIDPAANPALYQCTLTNTRLPEISLPVVKIWEDAEDEAGKRPDSVTVHLLRDGILLDTAVLDAAGGWRHTFGHLPLADAAGNPIPYTVEEEKVPFYEASFAYDTEEGTGLRTGCTVTNTYVGPRARFALRSVWEGGGDALVPPESVGAVIREEAGGAILSGPHDLEATAGWALTLPVPFPAEGAPSPAYRAEQEAVPGWTTLQGSPLVLRSTEDELLLSQEFTNYPEVVIRGRKTWADQDDAAGMRPENIRVRLLRSDGQEMAVKDVTAADGWAWDFGSWPTVETEGSAKGTRYTYTLAEDPVPHYAAEISGWNITNTWAPALTEISVTKVWSDFDDRLKLRPASVTVTLLRGEEEAGSALLSASGGWQAVFPDLYRTDREGNPITYSLRETPVKGYTSSVSGSAAEGFTITNTLIIPTLNIPVRKEWNDGSGEGRPASVRVLLRADGLIRDEATLEAGSGWAHTFTNLPLISNEGLPVHYTLAEQASPRYRSQVSGTAEEGFVITNTPYTPLTFTLPVEKRVTGPEAPAEEVFLFALTAVSGSEGIPPQILEITGAGAGAFSVSLDQTGYYLYTLSEENGGGRGWTYDPAVHTILIRVADEGGALAVADFLVDGRPQNLGNPIVFSNHYTAFLDISGRKIWDDGEDQLGIRPDTLTLHLLRNGLKVDSRTVSAEEDWSWSFPDLGKYDENGNKIAYSLEEEPVPGYVSRVSGWDLVNVPETAPYFVEWYYQSNGAWPDKPDRVEQREGLAGSSVQVSETDLLPEAEGFLLLEDSPSLLSGIVAKDGSLTLRICFRRQYTVTFDPNGGTLDGNEDPVSSLHLWGETITILPAPIRPGYSFLYWEGSAFHPGETWTVTEDHLFTALWEPLPEPGPDPEPFTFPFTFTKIWQGGGEDSIDWTFYSPDGTRVRKKFRKTVVSDSEWHYQAWFASAADYYLVENVPEGYRVRYENVGDHAGDTDRCWNGGTIINYKEPKTGDSSPLWQWILLILLGAALIRAALIRRR